jgi:hypothetical protein
MPEAQFVLASVVLVDIAPIPSDVAHEVGQRVIAGRLEGVKSTRRSYNPAGAKSHAAHFASLRIPWLRQ